VFANKGTSEQGTINTQDHVIDRPLWKKKTLQKPAPEKKMPIIGRNWDEKGRGVNCCIHGGEMEGEPKKGRFREPRQHARENQRSLTRKWMLRKEVLLTPKNGWEESRHCSAPRGGATPSRKEASVN